MRSPYESKWPIQRSPKNGIAWRRNARRDDVAFDFVIWHALDTWTLRRPLPRNRKTGPTPPRIRLSQRCAVSTPVKTVSRGKTLNVVDLYVSCLFVVVMFQIDRFPLFPSFPHYTRAWQPRCTGLFFRLVKI